MLMFNSYVHVHVHTYVHVGLAEESTLKLEGKKKKSLRPHLIFLQFDYAYNFILYI